MKRRLLIIGIFLLLGAVGVAWRFVIVTPPPSQPPPTAEPANGEADRKHRTTFELINKSTNLLGWGDPNPAALVRAVNHLRSLGKNEAIEALRAYVRYAPQNGRKHVSDSADQQRLVWIIPLLFVPSDPDIKLPTLGRHPEFREWAERFPEFPEWTTGDKWDPFWISLEGDLPFHNVQFTGRSGIQNPEKGYLVEWAANHADLRDEPLRPVNDPLGAADRLCNTLSKDGRSEGLAPVATYHIRLQAWQTIAHLIGIGRQIRGPFRPSDDDWERLRERAARLNIRWSEVTQDYVAGSSK